MPRVNPAAGVGQLNKVWGNVRVGNAVQLQPKSEPKPQPQEELPPEKVWVERCEYLKRLAGCFWNAEEAKEDPILIEFDRIKGRFKQQGYLYAEDLNKYVAISAWVELKKEKKNAAGFFKFATAHELLSPAILSTMGKAIVPPIKSLHLGVTLEEFLESSKTVPGTCLKPKAELACSIKAWDGILKATHTCVIYSKDGNGVINNRVFAFLDETCGVLVAYQAYGQDRHGFTTALQKYAAGKIPLAFGDRCGERLFPAGYGRKIFNCNTGWAEGYYDCSSNPEAYINKHNNELAKQLLKQHQAATQAESPALNQFKKEEAEKNGSPE